MVAQSATSKATLEDRGLLTPTCDSFILDEPTGPNVCSRQVFCSSLTKLHRLCFFQARRSRSTVRLVPERLALRVGPTTHRRLRQRCHRGISSPASPGSGGASCAGR